jgi:hypothetical protein
MEHQLGWNLPSLDVLLRYIQQIAPTKDREHCLYEAIVTHLKHVGEDLMCEDLSDLTDPDDDDDASSVASQDEVCPCLCPREHSRTVGDILQEHRVL